MSIKALDDIQTLLTAMKDRGAEMKAFEGLLAGIETALSDIVSLLEKGPRSQREAADPTAMAKAFADAIAKLKAPVIQMPAQNSSPSATDWTSMRVRVGKAADGSKEFIITKK